MNYFYQNLPRILSTSCSQKRLARERYVKPEPFTEKELQTEMFPSLPLHSSSNKYKVDKNTCKDDDEGEDDCNKDNPKASKMILIFIFINIFSYINKY